jgi:hypothetical protein
MFPVKFLWKLVTYVWRFFDHPVEEEWERSQQKIDSNTMIRGTKEKNGSKTSKT